MKWTIDGSHSSADFSVKHLMISTVKGSFSEVSGTIEFDDATPETSSVEATIQAASVHTRDERRDGHLRSADFFDVETYPTITFKSTSVEKVSDSEHKVTGDLTIHGVTKEVVLEVDYTGQAKSPFGDTRAGFTGKTNINRKDFGLNWNAALETGGVMVSDKVVITLDIEAIAVVPAEAAATEATA